MPICNCFHAGRANISKITTFLEKCPSLTLACASLFKPTGSARGLLKSVFNAENLILRLYWSIFRHFVAIHSWNVRYSQNCEKILKAPFLEVRSCSRSSMLINLKSLSPVLIMISSISVPICNRFHTTWANSSKITFLGGTPLWRPRSRETPFSTAWHFVTKRVIGAAQIEDFVILVRTVLIWLRRAKHYMLSRVKTRSVVHWSDV